MLSFFQLTLISFEDDLTTFTLCFSGLTVILIFFVAPSYFVVPATDTLIVAFPSPLIDTRPFDETDATLSSVDS